MQIALHWPIVNVGDLLPIMGTARQLKPATPANKYGPAPHFPLTEGTPQDIARRQRFLTEYNRPKIKDLTRYRAAASTGLNRLLPLLGKLRADQVQSTDVIKARDELLRHKSAASVKLSLAFLAAAYAWGIKQGIVTDNPVKGVERPIAHSSLDYFSNEEVARLLITPCDDLRLSACLRLALHAGLRKGELLGLRWQDLDFNTHRLTVGGPARQVQS